MHSGLLEIKQTCTGPTCHTKGEKNRFTS